MDNLDCDFVDRKNKMISLGKKIFSIWKAEITDKRFENSYDHFLLLWTEMFERGVRRGVAFSFIDIVVDEYMPKVSIQKRIYSKIAFKYDMSLAEFSEQWRDKIEAQCMEAFFDVYPKTLTRQLPPPKNYGIFKTKEEYEAYQEYSSTFHLITDEEMEQIKKERSPEAVGKIIQFGIDLIKKEFGVDVTREEFLNGSFKQKIGVRE